MAANIETMFYVRETPWHGLGTRVLTAPASKEALEVAGLNWKVVQEPVYTEANELIEGYKANVRDSDRKVLGVVTNRYKVIQNEEAFSFTDSLLGEGVRYETAGSLQGGKKVWLLARMPQDYIITGERISPYLVFSNTHDGSGAIKVALTPIRVVCNNTLNLALSSAKRSWSMIHTGDIQGKLEEAKDTLFKAEAYMDELGKGEGGAASAVEGLGVAAAHATGEKCERCWKYSSSIGSHAAHPTLCARCASVVEA